MFRRTTLQHTLVAALAASIVASSPAVARSVEGADRSESPTSSLAGTISPRQDLRGEHARDAARGTTQDLRGEHARDAARAAGIQITHAPPAQPEPAKAVPVPDTGSGDDVWLVVGIGLAATGIVAGAAGAGRRYRLRARRVAA